MTKNPDEFIPFLPSIGGEDSAGATDDGVMSLDDFKIYCERVRGSGEWGGEPEVSFGFGFGLVIFRTSETYHCPAGLDDRGDQDSFCLKQDTLQINLSLSFRHREKDS